MKPQLRSRLRMNRSGYTVRSAKGWSGLGGERNQERKKTPPGFNTPAHVPHVVFRGSFRGQVGKDREGGHAVEVPVRKGKGQGVGPELAAWVVHGVGDRDFLCKALWAKALKP